MSQPFVFHLVIKGPHNSWVFDVPIGDSYIGRQAGVDVPLAQQQVSRRHARLQRSETGCELTDLGSANGTRLNGKKLAPNVPVPLALGDRIEIASFQLFVESLPARSPTTPEHTKSADSPPDLSSKPKTPTRIDHVSPPLPPGVPPSPPFDTHEPLDPSQPPPGLSFQSERLLGYLPEVYQENASEFLSGFLAIFEAILFPIEWQVDNFELFLDPKAAPAGFLPWLASWFQVGSDPTWSESQLRLFLKEASQLYARHGTRWTLSRILEIFTGQTPLIDDLGNDLQPNTFRIKLELQDTPDQRVRIERLIDANKPIHTTFILELNG